MEIETWAPSGGSMVKNYFMLPILFKMALLALIDIQILFLSCAPKLKIYPPVKTDAGG